MNEDSSVSVRVPDYYNFEHWNNQKSNVANDFITSTNNRAFNQQQAGKLKPYSLVPCFTLSREEVEELRKRKI